MAAAAAARGGAHRLVTIRFSHFAEKARWGLDYCGVPYREEAYLPLFSTVGVIAAGGWRSGKADAVSTRFSTPLLRTADGTVLHDSHDILRWADAQGRGAGQPSLYPSAEAERLELHFSSRLGQHTRRVAYAHCLSSPPLLDAMVRNNLGTRGWQWRLYSGGLAGWMLRTVLAGTGADRPDRVDKSLGFIRGEFDAVGEALHRQAAHGRGDFLVGDHLTAADIAFASLAAPVLLVQPFEGAHFWLPRAEDTPPAMQRLVRELRAHPAGAHAIRLFRQHRGGPVLPPTGLHPIPGAHPQPGSTYSRPARGEDDDDGSSGGGGGGGGGSGGPRTPRGLSPGVA